MSLLQQCVAIVGPTASGKSSLGLELARLIPTGASILNLDSVQIYRDFDIGTAKPSSSERQEFTHHLLDLASWHEAFDVAKFREKALAAVRQVLAAGKLPIFVGGSPLYYRVLCGQDFHSLPHDPKLRAKIASMPITSSYEALKDLDPARALALHPNDHFRIARALEIAMLTGKTLAELTSTRAFGVSPRLSVLCSPPPELLEQRIIARSQAMLARGWVAEVKAILAAGCPPTAKPLQAIGYKQIVGHLVAGEPRLEHLQESIVVATRRYARKQRMYFRKMKLSWVWGHECDESALARAIAKELGF